MLENNFLVISRCLSVFTSQEQEILKNYEKNLKMPRAYGKSNRRCPLTPREVFLFISCCFCKIDVIVPTFFVVG